MKSAKQIAVVIGVIVGVILLALQIAAFAGPLPAPATEDRHTL